MHAFELETDRLQLRPLKPEDAETIFRGYASDPEATRYMVWPTHTDIHQTLVFIRQCENNRAGGDELTWAIIHKNHQQCIGTITVRHLSPKAEIGYVLSKAYWNQGLMTEIVNQLSNQLLALKDIYRVGATCHVENAASARVLEKCGFTKEGVLRYWAVFPNISREPQNCYVYSKIVE